MVKKEGKNLGKKEKQGSIKDKGKVKRGKGEVMHVRKEQLCMRDYPTSFFSLLNLMY